MPRWLRGKKVFQGKAEEIHSVPVCMRNDVQLLTGQNKKKSTVRELHYSGTDNEDQHYSGTDKEDQHYSNSGTDDADKHSHLKNKRCSKYATDSDKCVSDDEDDRQLFSDKKHCLRSAGTQAGNKNGPSTKQTSARSPRNRNSQRKNDCLARNSEETKLGQTRKRKPVSGDDKYESACGVTASSYDHHCSTAVLAHNSAETKKAKMSKVKLKVELVAASEDPPPPAVSGEEFSEIKLGELDAGYVRVEGRAGKLVGAHCSIAGALSNAVEEAVSMKAKAFGLFVRSQRTWVSRPMTPEAAEDFREACKKHGFPPNSILPHGSYLMNCCSPNPVTLQKSREALLDELQRCETLGLLLYNFHPGSTCGDITLDEGLDRIADSINWAHEQTKSIVTVIENMCCQGHTIGGRFEELRGIIDRVKNKARIGVCLDTCHAFAAGYDLSTKVGFDMFVSEFSRIVGFQYLKAMHLNDSKGNLGCHLDRHENIGEGQIGLEGFRRIMNDERFNGIPMILETPTGNYAAEIKTLYKLVQK